MAEQDIHEAARAERNRYQREWRAANKERVKAINARYWEKRVARLAAEQEEDHADNGKARA